MTYRVEVTTEAEVQIDAFIHYVAIERQEPKNAAALLTAIREVIPTLAESPHRCPFAPENQLVDHTVRMLIVKRTLYLLYWVDEQTKTVFVEGFRHARQPALALSDSSSG